jgi:hypothetical protein
MVVCFAFVFALLKMQQQDKQDLLCLAQTGPPNLENDDGNHDPRSADKLHEQMVNKLVPNGISKDIEKGFQVIYSLHDVFI